MGFQGTQNTHTHTHTHINRYLWNVSTNVYQLEMFTKISQTQKFE